ncbi:MAG: CHASE2 domain-containing protein, partial [Proteobacteria bacterium]|nr:CHASE2 domain-containing protein [Pseudomonadota bacterium]
MARRPWAKHVAAAAIIAFATLVGVSAPRVFPLVGWVENRVADIRVAILSPPEPQHPDIVVVAVTEDTLAALPYRSPLDRRFLADLLRTLEA